MKKKIKSKKDNISDGLDLQKVPYLFNIIFLLVAAVTICLFTLNDKGHISNVYYMVKNNYKLIENNISKLNNFPLINAKSISYKDLYSDGVVNICHSNDICFKIIRIERSDNLFSILKVNNISMIKFHNFLLSNKNLSFIKGFIDLKDGQVLKVLYKKKNNMQSRLLSLELTLNKLDSINLTFDDSMYSFFYINLNRDVRNVFKRTIIEHSSFNIFHKLNIDKYLIVKIIKIFSWDINFSIDLWVLDRFKILFQELYLGNKKIFVGDILIAKFINKGKIYNAIRYISNYGKVDYYSQNGFSLRKDFLRAPVDFIRISSHFSPQRLHPILHRVRAHKGIDYVAPKGSIIKASGYGKIIFIGYKKGYGKTIIIQHNHNCKTLYAHLSSFNNRIKHGSIVKQGSIVGYVGSTGVASGTHLHYEFIVNNIHRNPLTITLPKLSKVSGKEKYIFYPYKQLLFSLFG